MINLIPIFKSLIIIKKTAKEIFDTRGVHTGPTDKRQAIKKQLYYEFQSDKMQKLSTKAESVYREFKLLAQKQ